MSSGDSATSQDGTSRDVLFRWANAEASVDSVAVTGAWCAWVRGTLVQYRNDCLADPDVARSSWPSRTGTLSKISSKREVQSCWTAKVLLVS